MKAKKNVLIAPLDWGLGHATRCIPVINQFLKQGVNVCIAGNGKSLKLLQKEFPQLQFFNLSGYNIRYASDGSMVLSMLKQIPKILSGIATEKIQLRKIVKENNIDIVVSDNRYGAYSHKTKSIFITHQLNIQVPEGLQFLKPAINKLNAYFISKFDECWVPDVENGFKLSGELSESKNSSIPVYSIGPLSRFAYIKKEKQDYTYPIIAIISGPEPQRSIFEGKVIEQLFDIHTAALIIRGKPDDSQELKSRGMIDFKNHAGADEIFSLINEQTVFISRAGYSTIMDLAVLGNRAILIPTPGQTEQEYLSSYFSAKEIFFCQSQKQLNLDIALPAVGNYKGLQPNTSNVLLDKSVERILST